MLKRKGTPTKSISKDEFINEFEKKAMGIIQLNFAREHKPPYPYSVNARRGTGKRVYVFSEGGLMPKYAFSDEEHYASGDASDSSQVELMIQDEEGKILSNHAASRPRHSTSRAGDGYSSTPSSSGSRGPATSAKPRQISPLYKRTKKPNPLDISGAEGVEGLNEEEYELCSTLRILPTVYFHAKETLIENVRIRGFYKKSAAQKMLRIDVNKTGKLYDYFYSKGWLPQAPQH